MSNQIKLPENLTIHHIEAHFSELNKLFNDSGDEITVDASGIETIDTAGLQTLLVLVSNAKENGKVLTWSNSSEILKTSAEKLGLIHDLQLT
ncbi:STAS domain-containing protein [Thiomicrorhabdus arctica]|jgi:anti-anti-sigma regulatory factor|uniref:STAS domain-containing protein n=1 Tax=Thiomicrorhabdus arctica TaxID=131540 RepID=UPI00037CFF96|nr:STAS domain-containing protein [Thiomicrorhabdus arctica]